MLARAGCGARDLGLRDAERVTPAGAGWRPPPGRTAPRSAGHSRWSGLQSFRGSLRYGQLGPSGSTAKVGALPLVQADLQGAHLSAFTLGATPARAGQTLCWSMGSGVGSGALPLRRPEGDREGHRGHVHPDTPLMRVGPRITGQLGDPVRGSLPLARVVRRKAAVLGFGQAVQCRWCGLDEKPVSMSDPAVGSLSLCAGWSRPSARPGRAGTDHRSFPLARAGTCFRRCRQSWFGTVAGGLRGGALCRLAGHCVVEVGEFVGVVADADCEPCVRWCQEFGVFCLQVVGTPRADRREKPPGCFCPHLRDCPYVLPR